MAQNTSVIFVHGAWHTAEGFAAVRAELQDAGYSTEAVNLPSSSLDGPFVQGIDEDVDAIKNVLSPIVDSGKDVIVVMHSYGGIPGSSAAKGFSKEDRAKEGKHGGVRLMIYLTAFVLDEGVSMLDMIGGKPGPWVAIDGDDTYMVANESDNIFYNDLTAGDAAKWSAKLQKQATKSFAGHNTYAAFKHIPSAYLLCSEDNAIPLPFQEMLSKAEGGRWMYTETLPTSHSPFLSAPKLTAGAIRRAAGEKV